MWTLKRSTYLRSNPKNKSFEAYSQYLRLRGFEMTYGADPADS
jgi:hypothetical protein